MHYIFGKDMTAFSILDHLEDAKYVMRHDKLYMFFIKNNALTLNIYSNNSKHLLNTLIVQDHVKVDFGLFVDEKSNIHIVATTKKYDLLYIVFDGSSFERERLYSLNNDMGIPSSPQITVSNHSICILSSFVTIGTQRMWSLWSYLKTEGRWSRKVIDKSSGLCYNEHSFSFDQTGNIHILYRHLDPMGQSNLKYTFFKAREQEWDRPKVVLENNQNKYRPTVFISKSNEIYFIWIEINEQIYLCSSHRKVTEDYFKVNISEDIENIDIFMDTIHIWAVSYLKKRYYYDLCCKKQVSFNLSQKVPFRKGESSLDAKVKLFLDVKRELEYQLKELQNSLDTENSKRIAYLNALTIEKERILEEKKKAQEENVFLLEDNKKILEENQRYLEENHVLQEDQEKCKRELEQKEKRLTELSNLINRILNENSELTQRLETLEKEKFVRENLKPEGTLEYLNPVKKKGSDLIRKLLDFIGKE
ncbi:MAG: hypothetical protein N2645_03570 [Clostridia bacterium]|nr:hypothetical protein [Clostridia bacterium]